MQRLIINYGRAVYLTTQRRTIVDGTAVFDGTTKGKPKERKLYSKTVLLPQTNFPARLPAKKRIAMDEYLNDNRGFSELYQWQRENLKGPEFVLHDGPPYANGDPHMGHAINKILKDITLRSRVIEGRKVHYIPGWDCHGLPIELKILNVTKNSDPLEIRREARKYVKDIVGKQREAFRSWGVIADWEESGCYFTHESSYMKNQLHQFINLYEKGLVFRDLKPVYWSPSSGTALAESELIYEKCHKSKCATVRLRLDKLPSKLKAFENQPIYALTWTTMPWTLVANKALAFSPDAMYCLAKDTRNNLYLVGERVLESIESKIGPLTSVMSLNGKELEGCTYVSPFGKESSPFLAARHVMESIGTGFVHTAPAHGPEDFLLALENNLEISSVVNGEGRYNEAAGPDLHGLEVLSEGTDKVLESLARDILHVETLRHSYPYDWRTKKPVIICASKQWFIDINAIKQKAIDSVTGIDIYPRSNRTSFVNALLAQLEQRPYWCISRQRSWGTPIPVILNAKTGKASTNRKLIQRLCTSIDQYGPNCWWEYPMEKLIGSDVIEELDIEKGGMEKGTDIMDIWFDSGISWSAVLPQGRADLYLEGIDQFNGWFQSSLLTSIALQERPPYRALFVHGFAVDEKATKMSKSVGNVVSPEDILRGASDSKKFPAYGVDVLRWWVASHGCQHAQIPVTRALLEECAQCVQKVRTILHFLLGVSYPYPFQLAGGTEVEYRAIDRYTLSTLYRFNEQIQKYYENYEYHHVCKAVMHFVVNHVSSPYCHLIKDRLYCDEATSPSRLAAVRVTAELAKILLRVIAPILPHLAEEAWLYHPENLGKLPLYRTEYTVPTVPEEPTVMESVNLALELRRNFSKIADINTWKCSGTIEATRSDFILLSYLQNERDSSTSELCEILQLSSVTLTENGSLKETQIQMNSIDKDVCERCRRYPEERDNGLCVRCDKLLADYERKSCTKNFNR